MKKFLRLSVAAVFMAVLFSCSTEVQGNGGNTSAFGKISGKVFFSNAGENQNSGIAVTLDRTDGLRTVQVQKALRSVNSSSRSVVANSITQPDGSYVFDGLEAGTYTIYAASSYSSERAVCTNVVVRANETTVAESLKLTATGSISGKITLDGKTTGNTGFLVFVAGTSYMAMTDDSGAYCISGVPAKSGYLVVASKNGVILNISENEKVEANGNTELKDHNFTSSEIDKTAQGEKGADGTSITWLGSFASESEITSPAYLNAYFNMTDGCSYIYDGTGWTLLAKAGAKGDKGSDGTNGKDGDKGDDGNNGAGITWLGSFASESEISSPSYLSAFYKTTDGCSYIYNGTGWVLLAKAGAKGADGANGTNGINGTDGTNGNDGLSIVWKGELDAAPSEPEKNWAYFNKNDGCSYIWSGTRWDKLSEKGAQGDKGDNGADGTNGTNGTNGTDGADGAGITWLGSFASESEISSPAYLNAFYNTTDGCSYIYNGTKWTPLARADYAAGDIINFGSWPQTIKAENVTITDETKTAGMFTYYKGSDGEWYVKASENAFGSIYKYSDGTTVGRGGTSEKYFKVEPIKWRVLTDNYSGKKLLLAESILVNCAYYDYYYVSRTISGNTVYPNNYEHSRIRAYLNGLTYQKKETDDAEQVENSEFYENGFLQTAFSSREIDLIATVTVDNSARSTNTDENAAQWNGGENQYACNDTEDKVFLLSVQEATTALYGFDVLEDASGEGNARSRVTTDFAKANGASQNAMAGYSSYASPWWLRSPYFDSRFEVRRVNYDGLCDCDNANYNYIGVVPALCLK